MNQDLQIQRAMQQAALAHMTACGYPQSDIDRVAHVDEGDLLYICAGAGEDGIEYRITISDTKYTRATMYKIPLKGEFHRLVEFAKGLDVIREASAQEIPALVETALKEFLS